ARQSVATTSLPYRSPLGPRRYDGLTMQHSQKPMMERLDFLAVDASLVGQHHCVGRHQSDRQVNSRRPSPGHLTGQPADVEATKQDSVLAGDRHNEFTTNRPVT